MVKNGNGGDTIFHIFFIIFIINSFLFFYSIYCFFEMKLFHSLQGSKLKIKNQSNNFGG